jgi:hypothetical protein
MFRTKTRTEQVQDHQAAVASRAAALADQLRERAVPAVAQAAENAKEWSQPRVEAARVWVKPRVEHGIEVAAPKLESAVSGLAPKVDTARDKIVEELLPRVTEAITAWAAASTAAKDEALARGHGAAAVISGDAVASPKHTKRGLLWLGLGLLASAAAAAFAFMKKSPPRDDPWATPIAEPYDASSNGRHSAAVQAEGSTGLPASTTAVDLGSEPVDSLEDVTPLSPLDPASDIEPVGNDDATGKDDAARKESSGRKGSSGGSPG